MKNNRDDNESDLVAVMRRRGGVWIPHDRFAGYDGDLCYRGYVFIVEIKNPAYKWKLRPNEKRRQAEVEAVGVPYIILETIRDLENLLDLKFKNGTLKAG